MNYTGSLLVGVLLAWVFLGGFWLFKERKYKFYQIPQFFIDLVGLPVELSQKIWGKSGVPYALLLPNLLIFGFFTFLPLILNFWVSLTGGDSILLYKRPFIGWKHYFDIFNCDSIFNPSTCSNAGYDFWSSLYNTFTFVFFQVPIMCVVALTTAIILNKSFVGRGFWRAVFFYPVLLSPVVIANIWTWVLHRKGVLNDMVGSSVKGINLISGRAGFDLIVTVIFGIVLIFVVQKLIKSKKQISVSWSFVFATIFFLIFIWSNPLYLLSETLSEYNIYFGLLLTFIYLYLVINESNYSYIISILLSVAASLLLLTIQFDSVFDFGKFRPINWLVTPKSGWPFFWLVFVFCWSHMGFYMLIILAGLQAIPKDLYEAAEMDAAKPSRVFFRITFPLLMPTFTVVVVLCLIRSFQIFDEVYLLTGGGPGKETFMMVQNIYEEAFTVSAGSSPNYGGAAAASVLMAIVIGIFTFFQLYITRKQSEL